MDLMKQCWASTKFSRPDVTEERDNSTMLNRSIQGRKLVVGVKDILQQTDLDRPLLFTFVHGNHSQSIPVDVVPTVHHDSLFQTLRREEKRRNTSENKGCRSVVQDQ